MALQILKNAAASFSKRHHKYFLEHRRAFLLCPSLNNSPQHEASLKGTELVQSQPFSSKGKKKSKSDSSDLSNDENLSEKDVALREALTQISKDFGKEAVMWLGRFTGCRNVPVISTGSASLDVALGVGGLPKGRVVEIYGAEASGKTTLALHVIAEAQRNGGYCAFVDAEHALDPTLAKSIGVDIKKLLFTQPDCGEQAMSVVDTFVRCGSVDVVVIDSVAALVPRSELEGEMGDAHVALQARLMSQALRKLTPSLSRSQTMVIFTNQIRHKLNTFGGFGGPAEVTSGGNALKFYASVRLHLKRTGYLKKGEEMVGSQITVKVVKNKLAPPLKTAEFELEFGRGISSEAEVLDLGCKQGLITKSGTFYTINAQQLRGRDAAKDYLRENTKVKYELFSKIKENLFDLVRKEDVIGERDVEASSKEATRSLNDSIDESDGDSDAMIVSEA